MRSTSNNTHVYKFMSGAVVTVKNKEVTDDRDAFLGYESTMILKLPLGFGSEPIEYAKPEEIARVIRAVKFEDDQLPLDAVLSQLDDAGVTISADTNFDKEESEDEA